LVHTTECGHFRSIGVAGELDPVQCPVFNRPLLYFFYGRPAYRSKPAWSANAGPDLCPVCFVLKPQRLEQQYVSIYPFDSGAASGGIFEPHIPRHNVVDYHLTPIGKTLRRLTRHYFQSNAYYFVAEADSTLSLTSACKEASDYLKLITHDDPVEYDDRRSAIEVAVESPVPLRDTILTVVLPFSMFEDQPVRQLILNEWGVRPVTYNTVKGTLPGEYQSIIRQSLHDFLKGTFI
jgi:hypothetical protein